MSGKGHRRDASDEPPPKVSPKVANEAATWVARLHGPDRDRDMELACLAWQAESAVNRYAFERCTEVWMEVPNAALAAGYVPTPRPPATPPPETRGQGGGRRPALAALGALAGVALVAFWLPWAPWAPWADGTVYRTDVGEAQTVVLADGTRMSLNTATRVHVGFDQKQRLVRVDSGEAAFEVAREAARPFVVRAAASEVVALGTVFAVRLTPAGAGSGESLAVTLLEGQVAVRPVAGREIGAVAPVEPVTMAPGERVRLARAPGGPAVRQQIDRPQLDQVTAWRRNEAVFDRTLLADAVAEMNRYSRTPLVLVGELSRADWLVSGQYRTGDNAGFANALAAVHGLVVHERQGRLELSKAP